MKIFTAIKHRCEIKLLTLFIMEEKYALLNVIYFLTFLIKINNVKEEYLNVIHDATI